MAHTASLYQLKNRCSMAVAMQYGGGAMQYEHILEIAAHVLDMVPFINYNMFEIPPYCHTASRYQREKPMQYAGGDAVWGDAVWR